MMKYQKFWNIDENLNLNKTKMTEIYLEKENKTFEKTLEKPIELKKLLQELNISVESVILIKNDEITLEDEDVCNDDKIKILSVVSGG